MRRPLVAVMSGALFGLGLCVSQMVNPQKVLNFLDIFGNWDPSLLLVIGAATGLTMFSFGFVLKRKTPLFDDEFRLPTSKDIDRRLLVGSAIFGVGWGLGGYCPGPAIASITTGLIEPTVFVVFLLLGSQIEKVWGWFAARPSK
ncbi:MAG: putative membrane protein YedE/YeeE [Arenicella sp.]|jgi:uncharacterized membrane protein YedE/YeeE